MAQSWTNRGSSFSRLHSDKATAVFIGLGADVVENVIDWGCGVAQSWRNRIDRGAVLARTWHKRVLSGLSRESRGYNWGAVVAGTWLDRDCRESVVAQSGRVVAATGMYNFLNRDSGIFTRFYPDSYKCFKNYRIGVVGTVVAVVEFGVIGALQHPDSGCRVDPPAGASLMKLLKHEILLSMKSLP